MSESATPWTRARQAPLYMGILQARVLEWVAMPVSRGSSRPRARTWVSCICRRFFTTSTTWEARNTQYVLATIMYHNRHLPSPMSLQQGEFCPLVTEQKMNLDVHFPEIRSTVGVLNAEYSYCLIALKS